MKLLFLVSVLPLLFSCSSSPSTSIPFCNENKLLKTPILIIPTEYNIMVHWDYIDDCKIVDEYYELFIQIRDSSSSEVIHTSKITRILTETTHYINIEEFSEEYDLNRVYELALEYRIGDTNFQYLGYSK